ncbi:MAG TPA: V-type ATP synthase subunit A [Candidatus Scatomorpha intestinavium]|uniref:V-type ATP synthase alpha chain n=1 Tax=Candidatus Scatomorpha intestinavium TaxID=2840922 RepID=A0A9D1CT70_9FIRM|nr:V-type ATP synthase subunit A [Candidatus Scatomorpha intestinavium]
MVEKPKYYIYGINGPVIRVRGGRELPRMSLVYVGAQRLFGEVVSSSGEESVVQIYEDSAGLSAGEEVVPTYAPMSIQLGPGLIGGILDGIGRPLSSIESMAGSFIARGMNLDSLDAEKKWDVTVRIAEGDTLAPGQVFATCRESGMIEHRSMVPPGLKGRAVDVKPSGQFTVTEPVAYLEDERGRRTPLTLAQRWPVRTPRPFASRRSIDRPLVTGQRVIDTLFPVGKGGCAAIPGPFGAGKTVVQHQLAKWSDADIIVYLGCGERGNEMTQVLDEFRELRDPRSGRPLMERTILVANTSNMPVAAREASIYTGMTIAEYYRDMGYHVALMADSTSRWAEALREISGRLEEMPAEESFPAYLPSRLAGFYERAGFVDTLGGEEGSVTVIGAVSPQGGDFSEPVTQNTQRFVRCFWALDRSLAYARHFPSINWTNSYSEYLTDLMPWYAENFGEDFEELRGRVMALLNEESELQEIVKLIGADILPDDQKLVIETAKVIREGFLQQNAFHENDTYMLPAGQMAMLRIILHLYDSARTLVAANVPLRLLTETGIFAELERMKFGLGGGTDPQVYIDKVDAAVEHVRKLNS